MNETETMIPTAAWMLRMKSAMIIAVMPDWKPTAERKICMKGKPEGGAEDEIEVR